MHCRFASIRDDEKEKSNLKPKKQDRIRRVVMQNKASHYHYLVQSFDKSYSKI